jgi:hypothetical protein
VSRSVIFGTTLEAAVRHPVRWLVVVMMATLSMTPPLTATQRGPVDKGPGTLTAARKFLEGRWRLLSFEVTPPGQKPIAVVGAGTLVYDDFGNMTIDIRVDPPTAAMLDKAGIPTTKGSLFTQGKTAIDMQSRTLTFVLDGQKPFTAPGGPLALSRKRHWQIDGNVLTLITKGDDGQNASVGRWEKAP